MAVEVRARWGDTWIAWALVDDDETFSIGTAPGVDLPVLGFTRFPIVGERGALRLPAGVPVVHREHRVELTLGPLTIVLTPATRGAPLARPVALRRGALPYAAGALAAHLALLVAAVALADPPPPRAVHVAAVTPHPVRVTPPATPLPPPPPRHRVQTRIPLHAAAVPAPPIEVAADAPATPAAARASVRARLAESSPGLVDAMHSLWGPDWATAMDGLDPLYREGDHERDGFAGRAGRFDPTGRAEFASIPSGPYQTHAPEAPHAVELALCDAPACRAAGAIDRDAVTSWIAPHTEELGACFAAAADPGRVTLAFTIDGGGVVRHARAAGPGPSDPSGACAVAIVESIRFPATDKPTRVTYPIAFRPSG